MRKATKIWLVIATVLVLIGCILLGCVMAMTQWDFSKLSTVKMETNEYEMGEDFSNIAVDTDTADITFTLSDDGKCKVVCYEASKQKHTVSVAQDTLIIGRTNEKAWYDYMAIGFKTPKITVYLPRTEYAALSVKESTGDITVPKDFRFERANITLSTGDIGFYASVSGLVNMKSSTGKVLVENAAAGALDISTSTGSVTMGGVTCEGDIKVEVTTGKVAVTDTQCKNLTSEGDTGDITLQNVIATGKLDIERSTGDVTFAGADAGEIEVETDTGDVTGSLLTDKVFVTETDTGRVDVPKTVTGGKCEISTDTGNIKITIAD